MEQSNTNILLTNIQRFSLHDGPGIRTTVFLKGCSLRCPWCSNPENLSNHIQSYIKDGEEGTYGIYYTPDELYAEIIKDKTFYIGDLEKFNVTESSQIEHLPGGVTFSGGECLLQMPQLIPLCEKLNEEHIHMVMETCLFVPEQNLVLALEYIDFFYVDMKILDKEQCKKIEHGNLDLYLSNLYTLFSWTDHEGIHKPIVIRIPVIGTFTDGIENRRAVKKILQNYKDRILKIELIKEHNLGASKYKSLGMEILYHNMNDELIETYKNELNDLNIPVEVCKI